MADTTPEGIRWDVRTIIGRVSQLQLRLVEAMERGSLTEIGHRELVEQSREVTAMMSRLPFVPRKKP